MSRWQLCWYDNRGGHTPLSLVDDVRKQIESRLRELKPLVDEYHQLEKLATGWVGEARDRVPGLSRPSAPRRGRPAGRSTASRSSGSGRTRPASSQSGGRSSGATRTRRTR